MVTMMLAQTQMQTSNVNTPLWPIYIKHQHQCCHNSAMTLVILFLIENNRVTLEWGCNPFWSNTIVLNENSIHSTIAELSQRRL